MRSLITISRVSLSHQLLKFTLYPKSELLFLAFHVSKVSSITRKPMRSHRSRNSGSTGLWDVLIALTPTSFSNVNLRTHTAMGTAAPTAPPSWCRQTPFSLIFLSFNQNPVAASNFVERIPNETDLLSSKVLPSFSIQTALYKYPSSRFQRVGLSTTSDC